MQFVAEAEWDLSRMTDRARAYRLMNPPDPEELINLIASEAVVHASDESASWEWEAGKDTMKGCVRATAVLPMAELTFDALFNGRSGYRAQYYISPELGQDFNARLVRELQGAIQQIYERSPEPPGWGEVARSLGGPWSKLWVYGDKRPFLDAPRGEFLPRRWAPVADIYVWIKAPRPKHPAIDVKGTWLSVDDGEYSQDPYKKDRDCEIWRTGGA